jgi:hypothetical protein
MQLSQHRWRQQAEDGIDGAGERDRNRRHVVDDARCRRMLSIAEGMRARALSTA